MQGGFSARDLERFQVLFFSVFLFRYVLTELDELSKAKCCTFSAIAHMEIAFPGRFRVKAGKAST